MIKFYAHRSKNNHSFKDNSKEAILNVLSKDYISGIEIDIRITKDKKIIVYHDPIILIKDKIRIINETNLIDLIKANIYTLNEILKFIDTDKIIILEIKYENKFIKEDIDIFVKEIEKYQNLNIYVCSFNTKLIKYIKKNYNLKCGIIIGSFINKYKCFNYLDFNLLKYNLFRKIPKKESFIWTINDINKLKRLIKNNKNKLINVITDKAYLLNTNDILR